MTFEWLDIAAGEYEIGLRTDEAIALATRVAFEARAEAAAEPDELHPERQQRDLDEQWGNVDWLVGQLAFCRPAHRVALAPAKLTRTPVTVAQWTEYRLATGARMRETPESFGRTRLPRHEEPVTGLSWTEAAEFAAWAGAALPDEALWEAALRPKSRDPIPGRTDGAIGTLAGDLFEWCANEFGPYPGADRIAVGRIAAPPGGWWGTRTRRGGVIPGFPTTVVGRSGCDPDARLRDTTFRLMKR